MNREIHVRLCERLGAKFPGPTRRSAGDRCPYADQTRQCLLILVAGRLHYGRVVAISDKWLLLPKRAFAATEIL